MQTACRNKYIQVNSTSVTHLRHSKMDSRPILNRKISSVDFQSFYWLKKELTQFCREEDLKTSGSKIELSQRIYLYLSTGKKQIPKSKPKATSSFDWASEPLTANTIITDSYKNTENVRQFFKNEIGKQFKFNVQFMNWMKANTGKTLGDSMAQWKKIKADKKQSTEPKNIAPQFEYNTYLRDFLVDNPQLNRKIGIKLWNKKKSVRGDRQYRKSDLKYLAEN